MPSCLPNWTAWVRRRAPSLSKARLRWVLTVFSLTKRRSAISRLLRPLSDEGEDFEFAGGDAEGIELGLVEGEGGRRIGGDEDFAEDDFLAGFGELDAEDDEDDGDDGAIDFEGVLDDEELVLGPAEDGDEDAADEVFTVHPPEVRAGPSVTSSAEPSAIFSLRCRIPPGDKRTL